MSPAAAAAAAREQARARTPVRGRVVPQRRTRISGPSRTHPLRTGRAAAARPARALPSGGLAYELLAALERLTRNRVLDRLVRGRVAIAFVAFALIGIVTLQLGLLKLNTSIGRTLEREAQLQRENAALSIEDSESVAGDTVESRAGHLGMRLVAPAQLRFLHAPGAGGAAQAAKALRNPVPQGAGETAPGGEAGHGEGSSSEAAAHGEASSQGEAPAHGEASGNGEAAEAQTHAEAGAHAEAPAQSEASSGHTEATTGEAPAGEGTPAQPSGGAEGGG